MTDDVEEYKFPWESKTMLIAFLGLVSSLLVSFGVAGANLTAEQISGIATILFMLIMIVRKYGGGAIAFSKS